MYEECYSDFILKNKYLLHKEMLILVRSFERRHYKDLIFFLNFFVLSNISHHQYAVQLTPEQHRFELYTQVQYVEIFQQIYWKNVLEICDTEENLRTNRIA